MTINNNTQKVEEFDIHAVRKQFPILNRNIEAYIHSPMKQQKLMKARG